MDGALIQNIGTLTDTCGQGGYVDYDKSYDNETGDFSATYWFHEYCDKGSLISGLVRASGEVDLNFDPPELVDELIGRGPPRRGALPLA